MKHHWLSKLLAITLAITIIAVSSLSSVASAWHCSPNIYALNLNHANEIVTFFEYCYIF